MQPEPETRFEPRAPFAESCPEVQRGRVDDPFTGSRLARSPPPPPLGLPLWQVSVPQPNSTSCGLGPGSPGSSCVSKALHFGSESHNCHKGLTGPAVCPELTVTSPSLGRAGCKSGQAGHYSQGDRCRKEATLFSDTGPPTPGTPLRDRV